MALVGVEAGLALQARAARELGYQVNAHAVVPGFQQRIGGVAHLLGHVEAGGVRAFATLALNQADVLGAGNGQRGEQAFLDATQARNGHNLRAVDQAFGGIHDLLARDDDLTIGGTHSLDALMQQLGVVGTVRLKRARRAHGGARAAADALFRRDDQLVVLIRNAA